jgi:alpha-tubulin suppressor-like RCC1 family protein
MLGGNAVWWGSNDYGELGNGQSGTGADRPTPVEVSNLSDVSAIAGGRANPSSNRRTCAVVADGAAWCWGVGIGSTPAQVPGLTDAVAVTAGTDHACALRSTGGIACWGGNGSGELGNGSNDDSAVPVQVVGITSAIAITAGDNTTCALLAGGTARCWGKNEGGQLGDGSYDNSNVPVSPVGVSGATAIARGSYHTCVVLGTGAVQCWGQNLEGQLGSDVGEPWSPVPVNVPDVLDAIGIAASGDATFVLRGNGAAVWWGGNFGGSGERHEVEGAPPAVAIAAGSEYAYEPLSHACVLAANGTVWCWGANSYGQVGCSNCDTEEPTMVERL